MNRISLFILPFLLLLIGCQPKPDINTVAHPVHMDPFMAKKFEADLLKHRKEKDDFFRTDKDSPIPPELKPIFNGLEYYPIDWRFRFEGPVNPYPNPQKIRMIETSGEWRDAIKYGYIQFYLEDKRFRLQVYRLLDLQEKNLLFIPFVDNKAGKETYPAGRYIDLEEKDNGVYVIDFNNAYNPSCAYGGSYACPVTPAENRLPISIPAGEKILPIAEKLEAKHKVAGL